MLSIALRSFCSGRFRNAGLVPDSLGRSRRKRLLSCHASRLRLMQSALAACGARGYGGEGTLYGAAMRSSRQSRSAHDAGHAPGPGGIVRNARVAQGLSLAAFGERVGYSAAQVSRYERGITPLTNITVLRRFADALALPQQLFGLDPDGARVTARHAAISSKDSPPGVRGNTVDHESQWEDGDDPVRRRELLAGAAALAGATALAREPLAVPVRRPGRPRAWRTCSTAGR